MSKIKVRRQIHHYLVYIFWGNPFKEINSLYGNNNKIIVKCGAKKHGILSAELKQNGIPVLPKDPVALLRP